MEEEQKEGNKKSQTGPIIAVLGLIVIIVVGIVAAQGLNKPESQTQNTTMTADPNVTQQPAKETEGSATEAAQQSTYKDGTYTAVGNYTSPGGPETLGVTLTIANGVVTESTVEVKAFRPMSKAKQTDFAEHYKPQVEGKSIDEINLTKVSGSSLAPKGFNDAVEQIKTQAQA